MIITRFRLPAMACLLLLASCQDAVPRAVVRGWRYDTNPLWPGAIYDFADGERTRLIGRCHSGPVFTLSGGEYPSNSETFDLVLDGKARTLKAFAGEHGRALIVDDPESKIDLVAATNSITFRVAGWSRTAPADPVLKRLAGACELLGQRSRK